MDTNHTFEGSIGSAEGGGESTPLVHAQLHHGRFPTDHDNVSTDIVGTPCEDAKHWELQTTPFSCDVECQRGIIEALTGEHVSEAQLCTEAAERGWLSSSDGTSLEDSGKLLELHGVSTHTEMHARIGDIYEELSAGHKVIVGVRGQDLWDAGNPFALSINSTANHAIWVTGIDKSDPADVKVIINDSGDPDGAGKAYSLSDFTNAWGKSDYFYLATDKAPPSLHEDVPAFDPGTETFPDMVNWAQEHLSVADSLALATALVALRAGTSKTPTPTLPTSSVDALPLTAKSPVTVETIATPKAGEGRDHAQGSSAIDTHPSVHSAPPASAADLAMPACSLAKDIRTRIERNTELRRKRPSRREMVEDSDSSQPGNNVVKLKARR